MNSHGLPHTPLKRMRLPVPPLPQRKDYRKAPISLQQHSFARVWIKKSPRTRQGRSLDLSGEGDGDRSEADLAAGYGEGDFSVSNQTQVRPLIYPSELQKLNNKESTGNAIIVTFGNYPLMTKYTPSYLCKYYKIGMMEMEELRSHMFRADEVYYDLEKRNEAILGPAEEE